MFLNRAEKYSYQKNTNANVYATASNMLSTLQLEECYVLGKLVYVLHHIKTNTLNSRYL